MQGISGWQPALFYTAAFLNVAIVPKHLKVGMTKLSTAIRAIPDTPDCALGKSVAKTTWDYANGTLIMLGLLNYKWAKYGAPSLMEDKLVVAVNLVAGLWAGYTYYDIGMYIPLTTLWGAQVITAVAAFL